MLDQQELDTLNVLDLVGEGEVRALEETKNRVMEGVRADLTDANNRPRNLNQGRPLTTMATERVQQIFDRAGYNMANSETLINDRFLPFISRDQAKLNREKSLVASVYDFSNFKQNVFKDKIASMSLPQLNDMQKSVTNANQNLNTRMAQGTNMTAARITTNTQDAAENLKLLRIVLDEGLRMPQHGMNAVDETRLKALLVKVPEVNSFTDFLRAVDNIMANNERGTVVANVGRALRNLTGVVSTRVQSSLDNFQFVPDEAIIKLGQMKNVADSYFAESLQYNNNFTQNTIQSMKNQREYYNQFLEDMRLKSLDYNKGLTAKVATQLDTAREQIQDAIKFQQQEEKFNTVSSRKSKVVYDQIDKELNRLLLNQTDLVDQSRRQQMPQGADGRQFIRSAVGNMIPHARAQIGNGFGQMRFMAPGSEMDTNIRRYNQQ